ncbi:MAG TPA: CHC2 zinc finger domain-containing protein [Candidatus Acidoferrum sp.]|nr:CHC2 zinc finger domain-containing protein [Candidatus Acidoferrum sp.]
MVTIPAPLIARELKARVDLAAIAGKFTRLRRAGRQFFGLCPLHSERHPSFYVHPEKQVFKCFGCGAGGDIFVFVMLATGCDFRRALKTIAEFSSGVARESEPRSGERIRAGVGASPAAAKRQHSYSQFNQEPRARILAALDATNRRQRAIEATNRKASASLATACEPERGGSSYLLEETE